jgi:hypothetical protein
VRISTGAPKTIRRAAVTAVVIVRAVVWRFFATPKPGPADYSPRDLNRLRKLCPNSKLPFSDAMTSITFSKTLSSTFRDLMRKVRARSVDPLASLYSAPWKSVALSVPVRIVSVDTKSKGILTSAAPLSSVKIKVMVLLMVTGTRVIFFSR